GSAQVERGGSGTVEQHDGPDLVPHGLQLHGHLKRDITAKRMPAQQVRACRLHGLDRLHVVSCHLFFTGVLDRFPVEPPRLYAIKGLVMTDKTRQLDEVKHRASYTRHAEERPFAALLQSYEVAKVPHLLVATDNLGQSLDSWRLQQGSKG